MQRLFFAIDHRLGRAWNHGTRRLQAERDSAAPIALTIAALLLALESGHQAAAQGTAGPYSNYNWNRYRGPIYYNQGYAQYGLPGVGISPWNPIVEAQLNVGLMTARYNFYSSMADEANAAANLYYQRSVGQALQNERQAMERWRDARSRSAQAGSSGPNERALLPRNEVLSPDGTVLWPPTASSRGSLGQTRRAAEAAIRIAVREFVSGGSTTTRSVVAAKIQLLAYGRPALTQLMRADRGEAENLLRFLASLEQVLSELAEEA
jgi:hypothetical protein